MPTNEKWAMYLQALKGPYKKRSKIEFLNPDHSVAFALDNNPVTARNRNFIQEGSLTVNLQNGKRRTAKVKLANIDGDYEYNVNKLWFGQQIRLSMGLELPNGEDYYLPQGVFYAVNPEEIISPTQKSVTLNLEDKWTYLDGTLFGRLDGIYEVPLDTDIFYAIQSVLNFPRENGLKVDDVAPIFTSYYNNQTTILPDGTSVSDLRMPYTYRIEGNDGTYADIILEMNNILAGWIGYDATGRLRLDPSQDDILDTNKPILWQFTPSEQQFLGATYIVKNKDVFNDIIIVGEALTEYGYVAGRASNYDPQSDTNINLIGKKTYMESAAGYASRRQCEDLAAFKLKRQTILQRSVTIESAQMFHLQENQLVTIRRLDKPGTPTERHLINGFTIPIGETGKMTIQATSVQEFPMITFTPLPSEEEEPETPPEESTNTEGNNGTVQSNE